jgi:uncharacterized protein
MRNKFLWINLSVLLVLVLGACSTTPVTAVENPQQTPHVINVTGNGQVYLIPDVAYINVGVHTVADTVSEALKANNTQATAVSSSLTELGVDVKDIQTSAFNVYPQQQYGPQGEVTSTTYAVDNTVYITVRDLSKLGQILDVVIQNGANTINGIQFDVLDKSNALSDVRKQAVVDAHKQAQELADAAGVTLGDLVSINLTQSSALTPVYGGKGGAMNTAAQTPISAGQLTLSMDASLVYEIK